MGSYAASTCWSLSLAAGVEESPVLLLVVHGRLLWRLLVRIKSGEGLAVRRLQHLFAFSVPATADARRG